MSKLPIRNRKMRAVFPGSFDPLTLGHCDIIRRALALFDELVVGVLSNPNKNCLFSLEERVQLIEREFRDSKRRLEVASFSGLLVEFAHRTGARVIIRGLRAVSDYDYESQMALINRRLSPDLETLFLATREENSYISSSIVRQVASLSGDVGAFVPSHVAKALKRKFTN